jgi:hypothetical protein
MRTPTPAAEHTRLEVSRIRAQLRTQDNACTADPIYVVQKPWLRTGLDLDLVDNPDDIAWLDCGELVPRRHWPELNRLWDEDFNRFLGHSEDPQRLTITLDHDYTVHTRDLERTGCWIQWEIVQSFFTREGAERYIERNKHNLSADGEPRIYVDSLIRNREMQALRDFLLSTDLDALLGSPDRSDPKEPAMSQPLPNHYVVDGGNAYCFRSSDDDLYVAPVLVDDTIDWAATVPVSFDRIGEQECKRCRAIAMFLCALRLPPVH